MGGIDLRDGVLVVDRAPNELDELAMRFSEILDGLAIEHVFVAGYVTILAGRSRGTEDIDVLVERLGRDEVAALVDELERHDLWGPATPLQRMGEMLEDHIWIARTGEVIPHLEVKYVSDRFDRASLSNRIAASVGGATIPIGPIELQIAYKLRLGTRTDLEDAAHLHRLLEESLSTTTLEGWVNELDVGEEYERLKRT